MERFNTCKSIAYGSLLTFPFIVFLILPALKSNDVSSTSFFLDKPFVYFVCILTSILNGFGEGLSQPASGTYISDCATEKTKGFYFALFWAFYMGSQVFGNLIAAFVLGVFNQVYYVVVMGAIAFASIFLMFFLKMPLLPSESNRQRIETIHVRKTKSNIEVAKSNVNLN